MSTEQIESVEPKQGAVNYVNTLFPVDWDMVRHAGSEPIPHHIKRWWFALGGTPMILFGLQLITGIALTFYYVPSPDQAYDSVANITFNVRFGWYLRSLHKWSANLMIIAVFLHMLRVFFTAAYRHPRQLNWMIGLGLLGTTLVFGFTGYSLVYEQLSFWGATVATNLANAVPFIGPYIAYLLRGGPEIGAPTLTRFYILHIGILPAVMIGLLGLHVMLIRLHGVKEMHFEDEDVTEEHRYFKFWPDHVTTELMVAVTLMYLLTIIALLAPAGLGEAANPNVTPAVIKPEWYFYFNFRLLKLTSLQMSVVLTAIGATFLLFWPFIEEQLMKRFHMSEKVSIFLGAAVFLTFLGFTVWEAAVIH